MLYIVVGSVAVFVVLGIIFGIAAALGEKENPIKGAAAGAGMGALVGLHQGCGCAISLGLLLLGAWIVSSIWQWLIG